MPLFDVKKQLAFYGAYHREPTNVKIHMACVPALLGTGFLFGTATPVLARTPAVLQKLNLPLNLGTLAATLYSTLYLVLSPNLAGLTLAPLVLSLASLANSLHQRFGRKALGVGAAVHVASWIAQFVGHGKYEGRKPALLDNLAQALFLAPLFVWYEGLFSMGWYRKLREEVERGVEGEVARTDGGRRRD